MATSLTVLTVTQRAYSRCPTLHMMYGACWVKGHMAPVTRCRLPTCDEVMPSGREAERPGQAAET